MRAKYLPVKRKTIKKWDDYAKTGTVILRALI